MIIDGISSLDQILNLSIDPEKQTKKIFFKPKKNAPALFEEHTQLYFTNIYSQLTSIQKLRYNQLFASFFIEQFIVFEEDFTNRILQSLLGTPLIKNNQLLSRSLNQMITDETSHSGLFYEYNSILLPRKLSGKKGNRFFTKLNRFDKILFHFFLEFSSTRLFFMLWFLMAVEEYSLFITNCLKKHKKSKLGCLDPNYTKMMIEHSRDEARHVQIDAHLIHYIYINSSTLVKKINYYLLKLFLKNISKPKRGGLKVVNQLMKEFPELTKYRTTFKKELGLLGKNRDYLESLFSPGVIPKTDSLFRYFYGKSLIHLILPGN